MPTHLPTIRSKLAVLVVAFAIPSVLFSGLFVYSEHRQYRQHVTQTATARAHSVAVALDKDFRSIESALQTLSISPFLDERQMGLFYETAIKALPFQNVSNFVLIDERGHQRINTLKPFGAPLPTHHAAPPEILAITENKQTVVSNLFLGPVTGKPILAMGIPVVRDGRVPYSLNVGIFPERLYRLLKAQNLPNNWIAVIIDAKGQVVARTHEMDRFVGKQASTTLLRHLKTDPSGVVELTTLEGIDVISAFQHSEYSDWSVAVGVPKSELFAEMWIKVAQFVALSVFLTLTLLAFAWLFAVSQIIRPTEQLLHRMRALALGNDPGPQLTDSNKEFRSLEIGLEEMASQLQAQESEKKDLLRQLVTTLESITDGFILLDLNWHYQYINRRAEVLLNIERQNLLNKDWRLYPPNKELALARPMIERVMSNQTPINKTIIDGMVSPAASVEFKLFHTASGVAIYMIDVTQRKQMVQAQAAREAAEAANQAKNNFLARTSHELRTPLNAIVGLTQVLINDRQQPLHASHLRSVQLIESSSMHLMALINDILDISRAESGALSLQMEPTPVDHLIEECLAMVRAEALTAGLKLQSKLGQTGLYVLADAIRLRQVLINLLSNAIKYNKAHGSLALHCEPREDQLEFQVIDSGIGFTPKQMQHLFEPFNRLGMEKSTIPGTGMGLVIAKFLIEKMGGRLQIESTPGVGSKFAFSLPLCAPSSSALKGIALDGQTSSNQTLTLLASSVEDCHRWAAVLAHRPYLDVSFATDLDQLQSTLQAHPSAWVAVAMPQPVAAEILRQVEDICAGLKPAPKVVGLPELTPDTALDTALQWLADSVPIDQ